MVEYDQERQGWIPVDSEDLFSYDEIPLSIINDTKRDMINHAVNAMETMNKDERHITTSIKYVNKEIYQKLCDKIDALREEFLSEPSENGDRVIVLNIQAYPGLIERKGEGER